MSNPTISRRELFRRGGVLGTVLIVLLILWLVGGVGYVHS